MAVEKASARCWLKCSREHRLDGGTEQQPVLLAGLACPKRDRTFPIRVAGNGPGSTPTPPNTVDRHTSPKIVGDASRWGSGATIRGRDRRTCTIFRRNCCSCLLRSSRGGAG